jgi:hypothetical protein
MYYLITYYFINRFTKPYLQETYKILDQTEKRLIILHLSNALFASMWISSLSKMNEKSKYLGWLILIYLFISNLIYLLWWFHNYFRFFRSKVNELISLVKEYSRKISQYSLPNSPSKIYKSDTSIESPRKKEDSNNLLLSKITKLKLLSRLLQEEINNLHQKISNQDYIAEEPMSCEVQKKINKKNEIGVSQNSDNVLSVEVDEIKISEVHRTPVRVLDFYSLNAEEDKLFSNSPSSRFPIVLTNSKLEIPFKKSKQSSSLEISRMSEEKYAPSSISIETKKNKIDLTFLEKFLVGFKFQKFFIIFKYKVSYSEEFSLAQKSINLGYS